MDYPGFSPGKTGVLFFSRGRGQGHAVPDLEIAAALRDSLPSLDIRFVSYSSGAQVIRDSAFPLIDLGLPELNPQTLTLVLAAKLIGWLRPALLLSHEEFVVPPAGRIFDLPSVFLTDWFRDDADYTTDSISFADRILFLDEEGSYTEPALLQGRVRYLGCYQRAFRYAKTDRLRARQVLGLPGKAFVVSVLPGGYATEERAPLATLAATAFTALNCDNKRMLYVAGQDATPVEVNLKGQSDIAVLPFQAEIDRVMVASDVAITKANRKTALELERLGIPQVAVCFGLNEIDELRLKRVQGVRALQAKDTDAATLRDALQQQAALRLPPKQAQFATPGRVAGAIREAMEALLQG